MYRMNKMWIIPGICILLLAVLLGGLLVLRARAPAWPPPVEGVRIEPEAEPISETELTSANACFHMLQLNAFANRFENPALAEELERFESEGVEDQPFPALEAWVEANDDLLALWRDAGRMTNAQVAAYAGMSFADRVGDAMIPMRRIMPWLAERAAADKQWLKILEHYHESLMMHDHLTRGGTFADAVFCWEGTRELCAGMRTLVTRRDDLPPLAIRLMISVLQGRDDARAPFAELMRNERRYMYRVMESDPQKAPWTRRAGFMGWLTRSSEGQVKAHFDAVFSHVMAAGSEYNPGYLDEAVYPYFDVENSLLLLFSDPAGRALMKKTLPSVEDMQVRYARNTAELRASMLYLAVRLYQAENKGKRPADAYRLLPNAIRVLPRDPFRKVGFIEYRQTMDGWMVYSAGPDGRDDGGDPERDVVYGSRE